MRHKNSIEENFLELITEHFPDMLWVKDLHGRYLYANRAICENLLMTDTEEVIGKTDIFFAKRERESHPENSQWHTFGELCLNSDEIVLQYEETMAFEEYGNVRGEHTYLEVHKAPLYDKDGKLIGTIGSGRNITAQKKTERAITAMNNLASTGPVVLFEWLPQNGWPIKNVSRNVAGLLGVEYEEIEDANMPFVQFIHPEDLAEVAEDAAEYFLKKATSFSQDYRIIKRNKDVIWVRDFTVVEYEGNGEVASIKGYLLDNTAKVNAQEEIKRLNYTDILTELPNRRKIQQDLIKKKPHACIVFNIDKFREINDFFGVKAADSILTQVAQWFMDMHINAYRIGGDEFAALRLYLHKGTKCATVLKYGLI
ncbi:MAG: PAS domain S-box protein [Sulfurimonas sp.]|uniref:sensor domain-containing diguanylate cyclase n=1 Tax=Sulfurimonas sp. TaxID=2022749 RepID=UPI002601A60C|nr:sensor domain-containing diguanylate cyclase [Sulfurimonas sp.]MDD2652924.1 PAS domain S-box protein [Sulfurimonas sp.]MDD3452370.1 PAS domain S-box protein [Sulfurimonas sp.]